MHFLPSEAPHEVLFSHRPGQNRCFIGLLQELYLGGGGGGVRKKILFIRCGNWLLVSVMSDVRVASK